MSSWLDRSCEPPINRNGGNFETRQRWKKVSFLGSPAPVLVRQVKQGVTLLSVPPSVCLGCPPCFHCILFPVCFPCRGGILINVQGVVRSHQYPPANRNGENLEPGSDGRSLHLHQKKSSSSPVLGRGNNKARPFCLGRARLTFSDL